MILMSSAVRLKRLNDALEDHIQAQLHRNHVRRGPQPDIDSPEIEAFRDKYARLSNSIYEEEQKIKQKRNTHEGRNQHLQEERTESSCWCIVLIIGILGGLKFLFSFP
jgi:hypothetical protein